MSATFFENNSKDNFGWPKALLRTDERESYFLMSVWGKANCPQFRVTLYSSLNLDSQVSMSIRASSRRNAKIYGTGTNILKRME